MTSNRPRMAGGRIRVVLGVGLTLAFLSQSRNLMSILNPPTRAPGLGATPAVAKLDVAAVTADREVVSAIERMAREAPLEILREAQRRYREEVIDYTCTFSKQENLDGKLSKVQTIDVKFREKLQSVYMHWAKNPGKARRVIYVKDRWTKNGEPQALCEPEGAIARVIVRSILRPIHGAEAKAASRRTIDQFGFANALDLIIKYSLIARERNELKLAFVGTGNVDGRPTYVYERRLPYAGEGGEWPDRVLVYHLDTETLLPLSCASYADDAKQQLLGRYEYTDVKLNIGLTEADFDGKTYGM